MVDNKLIAKNTIFLYIRMLVIMAVTLYTSRVILDKLGVDDYGLYNVVGGVVGMLGFLNATLSTGTSRFIAYELGRNDIARLKRTFSTSFYTHLLLCGIVLVVMETIGLWFVYNKLVIPPDRLSAAVIVYQISIITTIISFTQVPYSATIMAHERMDIYAYVSIFEAAAKLAIAFLVSYTAFDRLIYYAILLALLQFLVAMYYRYYCSKYFTEARVGKNFDRGIFRELLGFSGWNIIANLSETLKSQGYIILINMFFQSAVVSAQAIGNQIANAMMQFIGNFRTAINPQIIKSYAAGEYEDSKKLTLRTTVYVFDLVLLLGLPSILVMDKLVNLWLVEVPPYTVVFAQLIILQRIMGTFDASFYTPMVAAGKLKKNAVFSIFFGPGMFVVLYVIYKFGGDVMWVQYISIIVILVFSFIIKPYILMKDVEGYTLKDFLPCYLTCFKVLALSGALSFIFMKLIPHEQVIGAAGLFVSSIASVALSSYLFLDTQAKNFIRRKVSVLIHKKK